MSHTTQPRRLTIVAACTALVSAALALSASAATPPPELPAWATGGTPVIAPLAPLRLMDTRSGPGASTFDGAYSSIGAIAAQSVRELPVIDRNWVSGVPDDSILPVGPDGQPGTADDSVMVMLNVTAIAGNDAGFLTVYPCGSPRPTASSVNYRAAQFVANAVLTQVGVDGKVCIYAHSTVDVVVDVTGHVPAAAAGRITPIVPTRLLETRSGDPGAITFDGLFQGQGAVPAETEVELQILERGWSAGVPDDSVMVMLNVTAITPDGPGFLTVYPCGSTRPTASTLNYGPGFVVANAVLTQIAPGGTVCIYSHATTHVVADATAFVAGAAEQAQPDVFPVGPARLLETRTGPGAITIDGLFQGGGPLQGGNEIPLQVVVRGHMPALPRTPVMAVLNVTAVSPGGPGFLTVYPCGGDRPTASSLNYIGGDVIANAVVTQIGADGTVCIFSPTTTHAVVDITGYVLEGVHIGPDLASRNADDVISGFFGGSGAANEPALGGEGPDEGRYLVFTSRSGELAEPTGGYPQVFWRDRATGETRLVSHAADGSAGNEISSQPSISADGQTVVFTSEATNLATVPNDDWRRVFVWHRATGTVELVSDLEANDHSDHPMISGDGESVVFESNADTMTPAQVSGVSTTNVYVTSLAALQSYELISVDLTPPPGGGGARPSISYDGSRIAYWSFATDVAPSDPNPTLWDIFVWSDDTGASVPITPARAQGDESTSRIVTPTISGDGRFVAYSTTSTNGLAGDPNGLRQDVFLYQIETGETVRLSGGDGDSPVGQGERIALSHDGQVAAFTTAATDGPPRVVWLEVGTGEVRELPLSGDVSTPTLSKDGNYVAVPSADPGLDTRFPASNGIYVFR